MSRIKVGDVLATNKGWSGEVVYIYGKEAVILSEPCKMLFVFNVNDGAMDHTDTRVILPPSPPEFDWSQVPEWTGIYAFEKRIDNLWWCMVRTNDLGELAYPMAKSKLPSILREWRGDWKDSLIVRPGKGEG